MIINGINANTFFSTVGRQRIANTLASKNLPKKNFDSFELSNFFNKFSKVNENKSQVTEIKKMLTKTENENAKTMADGITGYAYMEISLVREAMKAKTNVAKFNYYAEEKAYYQGLLNEANGSNSANNTRKTAAYDDYEYICKANDTIDCDKAAQALANVQSKIDSLIYDTQDTENFKTDIQTYNKCANSFSKAFDVDSSTVVLTESKYSELFGKIEATEENYVQKYSERADNLWKCYDKLKEQLNNSLDKIRTGSSGEERTNAIKSAFAQTYGNSVKDLMDLIFELKSATGEIE